MLDGGSKGDGTPRGHETHARGENLPSSWNITLGARTPRRLVWQDRQRRRGRSRQHAYQVTLLSQAHVNAVIEQRSK